MGYKDRNDYNEECDRKQRHVHEIQGGVKTADPDDPHQHRFCSVTGEAIPYGENDHIHEVAFRTDTYVDHQHEFRGKTGVSIPVGGRHVHYLESITSENDGHRHRFEFATLIENPSGDDHRHEKYYYKGDFHLECYHIEDYLMDVDHNTGGQHPMDESRHMRGRNR